MAAYVKQDVMPASPPPPQLSVDAPDHTLLDWVGFAPSHPDPASMKLSLSPLWAPLWTLVGGEHHPLCPQRDTRPELCGMAPSCGCSGDCIACLPPTRVLPGRGQ